MYVGNKIKKRKKKRDFELGLGEEQNCSSNSISVRSFLGLVARRGKEGKGKGREREG